MNARKQEDDKVYESFKVMQKYLSKEHYLVRNNQNINAVEACITHNYGKIFSEMLRKTEDLVNYLDLSGNNLLHLAAKENKIELV